MARLAIQCILYRSTENLPVLLQSLKEQTFQDFDVWFYENSEDPKETEREQVLIENSGIPFHLIQGEGNNGFSGGHQSLYQMHSAPFVMLLNDDVRLEPKYLEMVMARIESDAKIASVTGLIFRWTDHGKFVDTTGLEYFALGKVVDRFAGVDAASIQEHLEVSGEVYGVSGAVGIYRRSAVDRAGGLFDPSWFMYKEDVDLAIRLRKTGGISWFEPAAVGFHRRGLKEEGKGLWDRLRDEKKRSPKLRAYSYANQWRIYRRHLRLSLGLRDLLETFLGEVLRSGMVFLASPTVFFRAWKMILTSKPYAS